jgi:hypothetical protein
MKSLVCTLDAVQGGVEIGRDHVDLIVKVQDQIQFGIEVLELLHDGGGHGCPRNRLGLRIPDVTGLMRGLA